MLRAEAIMNFDADTLRALHDVKEVRIRTEKHRKTAVVIWVVVESGCGAVVLGRPCRLPPLSSGGALVGRP